MNENFFVTGGTGLVGANLIPRLLRAFPSSQVTLLLRGRSEADVDSRARQLSARISIEFGIPDAPARVRALTGDVTRDRLGISGHEFSRLATTVTHIVHGAATIRFDHPIEEARFINLEGTRRVLSFADLALRQGGLKRVLYIGTSSVSGRREGPIYEHELDTGQAFFNTYEQSKCESEQLVRTHRADIPITIVRPSIIIGDSTTGMTSTFNVIYIPLRLFHRGFLTMLPAHPETLMDLVPVDWIGNVITHLLAIEGASGKVCHLTAGPRRAVPLSELIDRARVFFDRESPLARPRTVAFVSQDQFARAREAMEPRLATLLEQLDTLLPYVSVNRLFDSATTDQLLSGSGIQFPRFGDYAERVFAWCLKTGWGKTAP